MILEELLIKLGLDDSGLINGLNNVSTKIGQSIGRLDGVGQGVAVALGAATVAVGAFGVKAVNSASDLSETVSKSKVVFGEYADTVINNAGLMGNSLGVSKKQYLDFASTIQAALTAGGMSVIDAANLSTGAVKTFADLASFHNSSVEDAGTAWNSAIRGQYEPIQKFFPFITDSYMKTYGIANGLLDANTKNLSANERAVILDAIAMDEKLNPAFNDFAETSDGLANQQRRIKATFENITATLGMKLLPVVNNVSDRFLEWVNSPAVQTGLENLTLYIGTFADKAIEYIPVVIQHFENIVSFLQENEGIVVAILATLGIAFAVFGWTAISPMLPVIAIFALIAGAIYLLYEAWTNNWGGIQEKLQAVWAFIQPVLQNLWNWLSVNIPIAIQALADFWYGTLLPAIQVVWSWINAHLMPLFRAWTELIKVELITAFRVLSDFWTGTLSPALKSLGAWLEEHILPTLRKVADAVGGYLKSEFEGLTKVIDSVTSAVMKVVDWFAKLNGSTVNVGVNTSVSGGAPNKGRASGGVINAGETVWVGEAGKEMFTAGKGGGYVTPNRMTKEQPQKPINLEIDYVRMGNAVRDALLTSGAIG